MSDKKNFHWKKKVPIPLHDLKIQSERLTLCPVSLEHTAEIFKHFTPEITRYMLPDPTGNIRDTEEFIRSSLSGLAHDEEIVCSIFLQSNSEFLGCTGLHVRGDADHPEAGIWIKQDAHGHGYGREAVHAVVHWAKEHLIFEHIIYPVSKKNISSRKIPESLGGAVINEVRKITDSGKELDEVIYAIPNGS